MPFPNANSSAEIEALLRQGIAALNSQQYLAAEAAFQQAIASDPSNPVIWNNLAAALHLQGNLEGARQAYESSLALDPAQAETRLILALLLQSQWCLWEAKTLVEQALAAEPERADAWTLLGQINLSLGKQPPAAAAFERALALSPTSASHSRWLYCLQYDEQITPAKLLAAHHAWNAAYGVCRSESPASRPRLRTAAERKLRLGFISCGFGQNPVGYLVLPLLEHLDPSQCTITCYFDARTEDRLTPRFRAAAAQWRAVFGLPTAAVAEQIRRDEIDFLVDLTGHLGDRLPVFALRPAPLLASWFGYVGTTGLAAMDFLIADRFHVWPGEEGNYSETILRLPNGYACYGPPDDAPDVTPLPALQTGRCTFACFNNPAKFSRQTIETFAAVLRRIPRSRLLLKYGGLQEEATQQRLRAEFAKRGVEPQRIDFEGWSPHDELLARYAAVDIALDTHPYSGGLTTCEALWMGVPVITCPGPTFAGRHSLSHLTNAGYPEFIAQDLVEYVELAAQWAERRDDLQRIRSEMRDRVKNSPLCNAWQFAKDFLAVVRQAHEEHQVENQ